MRLGDSWAHAQTLRQLFDHLSDAILLLDGRARITFANTAALRALPCEAGVPVDQLRPMLGDAAVAWVLACVASTGLGRDASSLPPAPSVVLPDGRRVHLAWQV